MRKIVTFLAAAAVVGVATASGAQAQALRPALPAVENGVTNVQWRGGYGYGPRPGWGPGYGGYYRGGGCGWGGCNNNNGAAVAAGVIGGMMLGAAAASAAQANRPPAVYYAPSPEPVPDNWIAYCSAKYRSFDPRTGTYLGYDGLRHPCQ
ncbi:BA14K family protein [Aquabacter sp. CN5-332]|uniref:BA14K family protein n=1 Tax=Aquabacter sp. CN5-332 TaxID=3156608 RepID=UPI0032B4270B